MLSPYIVTKSSPGDKNQIFASSMIFVKELVAGTSSVSMEEVTSNGSMFILGINRGKIVKFSMKYLV